MRKFLGIALVALLATFGAGEVSAQVRVKPNAPIVLTPRLKAVPRVQKVRPVNPKLAIIPPSVALKRAVGTIPNPKALGVNLKGPVYIVKLKQGGTISQVGVHSVTGAVIRIP